MRRRRPDPVLVTLSITEIISWGALYYSFPAAAPFIQADTAWSFLQITGAFSVGLVLSAIAGVFVGRLLDRFGPRTVMTIGSALAVVGLVSVGLSRTVPEFFLAWLLVGLAQSAVLYQPAFTVIGRHYGDRRATPLLVVVLVAGLASTAFVPLVTELSREVGWRTTYLLLATGLALVTIPLHALFLPRRWPPTPRKDSAKSVRAVIRTRPFWMLQAGMTLIAFGLYAVTLNLIPLLTGRGVTPSRAAVTFGLVGVGQIIGRVFTSLLSRNGTIRSRPAIIGGLGALCLALLALVPGPQWVLILLAIAVGGARGAMTLAQANAVIDRWGSQSLGVLNGVFGAPITVATALAPVAGVLAANATGSFAMGAAVFAALVAMGALLAGLSRIPRRGSTTALRESSRDHPRYWLKP